MRVLIFAYGSRGDVQPFVALADRLRREGHDAVLAAPSTFTDLAEQYGLTFVPLDSGIIDFYLHDPDVVTVLTQRSPSPSLVARTFRRMGQEWERRLPVMLEQMRAAAAGGADLVVQVYDETPVEHGHHLAEMLGVPWVLATVSPHIVPSWYYPAKMMPAGRSFPRLANRASHVLRIGLRSVGSVAVRRWRRDTLGLPNRWRQDNRLRYPDGSAAPVIHSLSSAVVSPAPDWPDTAVVTGFCFARERGTADAAEPSPEMVAFLAAGDAPVCVSFGSIRGPDPREAGRTVVDALTRVGRRAVVVTAGGSIQVDAPPPHVMVVDEIAYSWLFERVDAVVHGGNVGISAEAMRAGVPQVTCPAAGESLAWAAVLAEAEVATPPIRLRDLTVDNFAAALVRATTDDAIRAGVARAAERVRAEDGTGAAVRVLERIAEGVPPWPRTATATR